MTTPEDDISNVLDPHGNARRLYGLRPRVMDDPVRLADIYDKSGTFGVAWTIRGLAARLAAMKRERDELADANRRNVTAQMTETQRANAAEARLEAVREALDMEARSSVRVAVAREYLNGNEP